MLTRVHTGFSAIVSQIPQFGTISLTSSLRANTLELSKLVDAPSHAHETYPICTKFKTVRIPVLILAEICIPDTPTNPIAILENYIVVDGGIMQRLL